MLKNVEDIIPSNRRSIRDVPMPEERRQRTRRATDKDQANAIEIPIRKEPTHDVELPRMAPPTRRKTTKVGRSRKGWWLGGVAILVAAIFVVLSFMRSATLEYTPTTSNLSFSGDAYTAYKTGEEGALVFSVVNISDSKSLTVPATGQTQVSTKASGQIVIYNNASASAQPLVKTTRFQTPDGKIYRIQDNISIPGKTSSGPGSITVTVVADQPGESYNIGLSDFTLPGLAGSAKFSTIYARSKTPMTGGFVGTQKGVDPSTLASSTTLLGNSLKQQLIAEAEAEVPADFVLFPSLSTVTYSDVTQSSSTDTTVNLNERGNFYGVIFKKSDLAEYLKENKLSLPDSQAIAINDLNDLTFAFAGNPPADLLNATAIDFTISGQAVATWQTDENTLKKALAGISKSNLGVILKQFPSIASANAVIRPFWKTTFPSQSSDITLKQNPAK